MPDLPGASEDRPLDLTLGTGSGTTSRDNPATNATTPTRPKSRKERSHIGQLLNPDAMPLADVRALNEHPDVNWNKFLGVTVPSPLKQAQPDETIRKDGTISPSKKCRDKDCIRRFPEFTTRKSLQDLFDKVTATSLPHSQRV